MDTDGSKRNTTTLNKYMSMRIVGKTTKFDLGSDSNGCIYFAHTLSPVWSY